MEKKNDFITRADEVLNKAKEEKEKTLFLEKQGLKMKVIEDKRSCPKEDNWGYPVTINLIT